MPRTLAEMLTPIEQVLARNDERKRSSQAVATRAHNTAARLPLIHRTGRHDQWHAVFARGRLKAGDVGSQAERDHGQTRAVYAFVGSGAYPHGHVALVFESALARRAGVTFTPFDTGALDRFMTPDDPAQPWDQAHKTALFGQHQASGSCLAGFAGPYLAAHFREPHDYVVRGQTSEPDFAVYHGLVGASADRRAWTLEVQSPEDIPLQPDDNLRAVLLDGFELLTALPPEYRRIARIIRPDDDETSDFYTLIAAYVRGLLVS